MKIADLIPQSLQSKGSAVLDKARDLLQGETLRAIGYGAGVVIYLVAKAVGSIPDLSFDQAVLQAGAAAAVLVTVIESARRFVFSPKTVAAIVTAPPAASGPVVAAVAAGVKPATIMQAAYPIPAVLTDKGDTTNTANLA